MKATAASEKQRTEMNFQSVLKTGLICLLACFLIIGQLFASEKAQEESNIKELFTLKYEKWVEWKSSDSFRAWSDTTDKSGKYWNDLIDLGMDSLPYLIEKMKEDNSLAFAFTQITLLDIDFMIEGTKFEKNKKGFSERIQLWWKSDRKTIDHDILKEIGQIKSLKQKMNNKDELNLKLEDIRRRYGIFALPYVVDEVKAGDNDFAQIALYLLRRTEKDDIERHRLLELTESDESSNIKGKEVVQVYEKKKAVFEKTNKFIRDSHDEK